MTHQQVIASIKYIATSAPSAVATILWANAALTFWSCVSAFVVIELALPSAAHAVAMIAAMP